MLCIAFGTPYIYHPRDRYKRRVLSLVHLCMPNKTIGWRASYFWFLSGVLAAMETIMMDKKIRAVQDGSNHSALASLVKFDNPRSLVQRDYGGPLELVRAATMEAVDHLDPKDRQGRSIRAAAALPSYYHRDNNSIMGDSKVRAVQDGSNHSALASLVKFDNPKSLVQWDYGGPLELVRAATMEAVDHLDPKDRPPGSERLTSTYHSSGYADLPRRQLVGIRHRFSFTTCTPSS
jgi:hypothetical protein